MAGQGMKMNLREALIREKKRLFVKLFRKRGGLTDFIPLFYFSKYPSNTLQHPSNTILWSDFTKKKKFTNDGFP